MLIQIGGKRSQRMGVQFNCLVLQCFILMNGGHRETQLMIVYLFFIFYIFRLLGFGLRFCCKSGVPFLYLDFFVGKTGIIVILYLFNDLLSLENAGKSFKR